jgi:enterochelin esterase-like enzyme
MPRTGAVTEVAIPPTTSGFSARSAWIYVPPAYLTPNHPLLPVLFLIAGQPGTPRDWLDGGQLAQQMDTWAAAHAGLAPVVVMPDATGSMTGNPLCMNSALGQADTYLATDVVSWVSSALRVDPDHAHWAVGGYSYGGTCALQLAVAHPGVFPSFLDISGQRSPTLGGRARTVAATFGGNTQAFAAVDPIEELATRPEPGSAGYVVVGAQDHVYRRGQQAVAAAARAAGMSITYRELPGAHNWDVWRPALTDALPWLSARMGLPR